MNEEKVVILTLLSEISTIIGKLNNDKKLNTIKKKVTGLHKYLKKKNKTKNKPKNKTFKTSKKSSLSMEPLNDHISDPEKNVFDEPIQDLPPPGHNTLTDSRIDEESYFSKPDQGPLQEVNKSNTYGMSSEPIPSEPIPSEPIPSEPILSGPSLTSRD
jgi:hypothetical protein